MIKQFGHPRLPMAVPRPTDGDRQPAAVRSGEATRSHDLDTEDVGQVEPIASSLPEGLVAQGAVVPGE